MIDTGKVHAVLYGTAIGDALGVPVEAKSASAIMGLRAQWNSEGSLWPEEYRATSRKNGMETWNAGDISDDTEMSLVISDVYLDDVVFGRGNSVDLIKLAAGFVDWAKTNGRGMGRHTEKVLSHPEFLTNPLKASKDVWEQSNRQAAPNGAIMRTSFVGLFHPEDLEWTAREAAACAAITHADPRCQASAVAVSVAVASLVTGGTVEAAIGQAIYYASPYDPDIMLWTHKSLPELSLDEGLDSGLKISQCPIGFTYKCLGASFYALRQAKTLKESGLDSEEVFRTSLYEILFAGGDTDTNAAVSGALLGAYLGLDAIPKPWIEGLTAKLDLDLTWGTICCALIGNMGNASSS